MALLEGRDYAHILMTRFNLPTPGKENAIRNRPGWLDGRFDLFERFCLPTIAAQTERPAAWLIFFDEQTSAAHRERIERARGVYPFTPVFTGHFDASGWRRLLRANAPAEAPWLLTTRMDNDDGLSSDHVSRLRATLSGLPELRRMAFNFPEGVVLSDGRVYANRHLHNAFFSWLEPNDDAALTALGIRHMDLADHGPIMQIEGPAAWLQVVHGGNVSNKIRGRRVSPEAARRRFCPEALGRMRPAPGAAVLLENLFIVPLRALRDAAVALVRRMVRAIGAA